MQAVRFKKMILQSEKLFKRKYAKSARDLKYLRKLFESSAEAALEIKKEPESENDEPDEWGPERLIEEGNTIESDSLLPSEVLLLPIPKTKSSVRTIELRPQERVKFRSTGDGDRIIKILNKHQYACDFEGCTRSFNEEYKLNLHKKIHSPESFECPVCQRIFQDEQKFNSHVKYHNNKAQMRFCCDHCGKKFPIKSKLRQHVDIHLPRDQRSRFICHVCAKTFPTQNYLNRHVRSHDERSKTFQCEKCPARFYNSTNLRRHMVTHKQSLFECSECHKGFKKKLAMVEHMKKVHGIDQKGIIQPKEVIFKCNKCDQSFKLHRLLRIHQALDHDNEKNELKIPKKRLKHKCKLCVYRFNYPHELKNHIREAHLNEMQYDCLDCDEKFLDSEDFDKHMAKVHGITILEYKNQEELDKAIEAQDKEAQLTEMDLLREIKL